VPLSENEIKHIGAGLRYLLVPELGVALESEGRMIGAAFALLDFNPTIKAIDGRLFPFGFIHLLRAKRKVKKARFVSANVLPEYHRMGLGMVLAGAMVPFGREFGITEAEMSWILESNTLSLGSVKKGGGKHIKTYRIYDLDPD
jgi:hypothetical protein